MASFASELPQCISSKVFGGASRAPVCGWLLKRKSDKAISRVLCGTNKRYFTVDFESQVVYYSHAEGSKSVSQPTAFRNIMSVEPLSAACASNAEAGDEQDAPAIQRSDSKRSVGSAFMNLKMPSLPGLSKRPVEQHGFVLQSAGKATELLCSSRDEAEMWIATIREAMSLAAGDKCGPISGMDDVAMEVATASGNTPTPRSELAVEDSDLDEEVPMQASEKAEVLSGSDEAASSAAAPQRRGVGLLPPKMPSKEAKEASKPTDVGGLTADRVPDAALVPVAPAGPAVQVVQVVQAAPAAPVQQQSQQQQQAPAAPSAPAASAAPVRPAVVPQRVDYFSKSESSQEVEEVVLAMEEVGSGRGPEAQAWEVCAGQRDSSSTTASAASRYGDKAKGMSMHERLSQMEFSDDEDADDDPLGLGAAKTIKKEDPVALEEQKGSIVEEACQAFVQEADSEED